MKNTNKILLFVLSLVITVLTVFGLCACGEDQSACSHTFGEWNETKAATCTTEGTKERTCSLCGEKETAVVEKTDHEWIDATCGSPKKCKNCPATEGPADSHAFNIEDPKEEALKSAATCNSAAVYFKSCSCGAISTNDADVFYGATLNHKDENTDHICDYGCGESALGEHSDSSDDADHVCDYGCGVTLELCYDDPEDGDHYCDVCRAIDASGHSFSEATCLRAPTCTDCGLSEGSKLDHIDRDFDHVCDFGCSKNDIGEHSDSDSDDDHLCDYGCKAVLEKCFDSDSDKDHLCDVCGKENVTVHSYTVSSTTAATCEDAATVTYVCNCGHFYKEDDGDALGHDLSGESKEVKVSGCEYVIVYICNRGECGEEIYGETVYHHEHIATITTPATCRDDGVKTLLCKCGDSKTEPIEHNSTGHNWETGKTEGNIRTDVCSICKEEKKVTVYTGDKTDEIEAGDLADTEIELNDANISLDKGVVDSIGNDQKVTVSAEKLIDSERDALGLSKEQEKQVGDSPIYNFTINNGKENVSDFGKNNWVTITLPYKLEEGEDVDSIAIWFISDKCQKEDCEFGDKCDDVSHRLVSIFATYNNGYVTFKTNHFSYYTVTRLTPAERCALYGHGYVPQHVDGSCTKDEYDLFVCVRCHHKYVDNLVPADGHDYVTERVEPTCTTDGYVKNTCSDCSHTTKQKLAAIGHNYVVSNKVDATCTADGYEEYKCEHCNDVYTVSFAKLPHEYRDEINAPSCSSEGFTAHICVGCNYSYADTYVPALGHDYETLTPVWADDFSTATLVFVCKNSSNHTATITATIEKTVTNGTCSNFVKTVYTATFVFEGITVTDEKTVEVGTPDHNFSDAWSSDDDSHWRECVCGEKTDVSEHAYDKTEVILKPTCSKAGKSVSSCVCGKEKESLIPPTGEHDYVDGACSECGATLVENYYLGLLESYKNINGFSVTVSDLSFEVKTQKGELADAFEVIGSVKQIDITELELYVIDGEILGAARGSIIIYNGPISNADAVYEFKAYISDGMVYIVAKYGKDIAKNDTLIKITVESALDGLLSNFDLDSDALSSLATFTDEFEFIYNALIGADPEFADEIVGSLFNILLTFEQQSDGSYVAILDFDKIATFLDALENKSVAEVIDLYFGDGSFDATLAFVKEVLALELSELPEFLHAHGFDTDEIIDFFNSFAKGEMGAPSDFDISDMLYSKEYEGICLGMLIFETEDDSYVENVDEIVDMLRESTPFSFIPPAAQENIIESVSMMLDIVSDDATISFTTDENGNIKKVDVNCDQLNFKSGPYTVDINVDINVIINGRIDVSWSDIVKDIEDKIILPSDDMLEEGYSGEFDYSTSGDVEFLDRVFTFNNGRRFTVRRTDFDKVSYIIAMPDCTGWYFYEVAYASEVHSFIYASIDVDGKEVLVFIDEYTNTVVGLVKTESGYHAIYSDGTERDIETDTFVHPDELYDQTAMYFAHTVMPTIYFTVLPGLSGGSSPFGDYVSYYYNETTGEYGYASMHEIEETYILDGRTCRDGLIIVRTCKTCGHTDERSRSWCNTDHTVIDLSEHGICGGRIVASVCMYCGNAEYIESFNTDCVFGESVEDVILDANGKTIGIRTTETCEKCGTKIIVERWIESVSVCEEYEYTAMYIVIGDDKVFSYIDYSVIDNHIYEYTVNFHGDDCEDGVNVNYNCTVCGYNYSTYTRSHDYVWTETNLSDYGCDSIIRTAKCKICEKPHPEQDMRTNCVFGEPDTKEILGEDGYLHVVTTAVCEKCGLKYVVDDYSVIETSCITSVNSLCRVYNGNDVIYEFLETYERFDHDYQTSIEHLGASCDDGFNLIRTCTKCGDVTKREYHGHYYEERVIFLAELGFCDGYVHENYCIGCGDIGHLEINDMCHWVAGGSGEDGLTVYRCRRCEGIKRVVRTETEKDEECRVEYSNTIVYMLGNEVLYECEQNYFSFEHDYVNDFKLDGNSCREGLTVYYSCKDCDFTDETHIDYHFTITDFNIHDIEGVCDKHELRVSTCPCGEEEYVDFGGYSFDYNDVSGLYYCPFCDIKVEYDTKEIKEGCLITTVTVLNVYLGDEALYSYTKETSRDDHEFSKVTVSEEDGFKTVTLTCANCEAESITSIYSAKMENHDEQYYYDFVFTPKADGVYTIYGFALEDTYVTLLRNVGGKLIEITSNDDGRDYGQFLLSYSLTAGSEYVYRIGFYGYDEPGEIPFAFVEGNYEYADCSQKYRENYSVLLPSSDSCEDGVYNICYCYTCGTVIYQNYSFDHSISDVRTIDLSAHSKCGGTIRIRSCPCGEIEEIYKDFNYNHETKNKYYDEENRLINVMTLTCDCGLRYTESYYSVRDASTCTETRYYSVVVNIRDVLVLSHEYTTVETSHNLIRDYVLKKGEGSSCEDGVIWTTECLDCDYKNEYEYYYHHSNLKELVNLSDYGCVCGGQIALYQCACGAHGNIEGEEILCDIGGYSTNLWIEDVVVGNQYTINGYTNFYASANLWICAVTDPADRACAYKIRTASYWLKDANECLAYQYVTCQLGYNPEDGTFAKEITYKTGAVAFCHNYNDLSDDHGLRFECPDCGSYYTDVEYYDENGNCTGKETKILNTIEGITDKNYYEYVCVYSKDPEGYYYTSREYDLTRYFSGEESWGETTRSETSFVGPFGEPGREVKESRKTSYGYNNVYEYAYVIYKHYRFDIYTYSEQGNFWSRNDYSYTFNGECICTSKYSDSDGYLDEKTYNCCHYYDYITIKDPTCTQDGVCAYKCVICGNRSENESISPTDHSWIKLDSQWYFCYECGLENANGISGSIVMEDLTDLYGNGENYVVGYYAMNEVKFSYYLSLILPDKTEIVIPSGVEFIGVDGLRAIAFSKAAVDKWASDNGYTEYNVRFSFVPDGSDGSFDYGITFTENLDINTISSNVSMKRYIKSGEPLTFTVTPEFGGYWIFTSVSDADLYAELCTKDGEVIVYADDGGYRYYDFLIGYELKAGETYILRVYLHDGWDPTTVSLIFGTNNY